MSHLRCFSLVFVVVVPVSVATGGCGSSDPPGEIDEDFPLPLAAGLSPTPPMGWNSWNKFACNINATFVKGIADAMVSSGMKDAGYQYINIDDCWSAEGGVRAADGSLQPDLTRFPDGIGAVADYVHGLGLKLGIYGDRGWETCGHRAGSEGHEMQDAATFASWGIDYVKWDNCAAKPELIQSQYQLMRDALDATGRPIVFSVCAWSFYEWALRAGHLQRTTTDIRDVWLPLAGATDQGSIMTSLKLNRAFAAYGGPNHWNDPDMLEVGNSDNGIGPVTTTEYQSHFSLWAITAAPLIAGNDLRNMTEASKAILTNEEIIAINQDALGLQAAQLRDEVQSVWAKPLNESGARAVVLFNEDAAAAKVSVRFDEIGLAGGSARVRDLQARADLGTFRDSFTADVPGHGTATLKIVGREPPRPRGTAFLSELTPIYAANGLGPVARDKANGGTAPITIAGTTFDKGLGMAAPAAVIYRLGGKCARFTAQVGLDGISTGGAGTVRFQVLADGEMLFDSDRVTGTTGAMSVDVSLVGRRRLKLLVTNAEDGSAQDRASWGDAKVECEP
jgi:alpha-galactosidase